MAELGILEDYVGCMFSEKTESMMSRVRRAEVKNRVILVFTPDVDWRGAEDLLYSHADRTMRAIPVDYHSEEILKKVKKAMRKERVDGAAIDEAHFFDEDLPEVVKELKRKLRLVLIAHLNYTFDGRPFPLRSPKKFEDDSDVNVGSLMELASKVYTLHAECTYDDECENKAYFSQRIIGGKPVTTGPTILIGEQEYEARCREHIIYPPTVNMGRFAGFLELSD